MHRNTLNTFFKISLILFVFAGVRTTAFSAGDAQEVEIQDPAARKPCTWNSPPEMSGAGAGKQCGGSANCPGGNSGYATCCAKYSAEKGFECPTAQECVDACSPLTDPSCVCPGPAPTPKPDQGGGGR